jgi:hypothetical protein
VVRPFVRETTWKQFCANAKTFESTHHAAYETVGWLSSTVVSNPCANDRHFLAHYVPPANRRKEREPTSGLKPLTCSLRVISQVLQRFVQACKSRIDKPISFLCLALCCTVLCSRWYQSGIKLLMLAFPLHP